MSRKKELQKILLDVKQDIDYQHHVSKIKVDLYRVALDVIDKLYPLDLAEPDAVMTKMDTEDLKRLVAGN